jgi:hypothetical protein
MTRDDLLALLDKNTIGAELGVCDGAFSQVIMDTVQPSRLYLVDVWRHIDLGYPDGLMTNDNKQTARYRRVLSKFLDHDCVRVIRDYTNALVEILPPKSLDWIYIDADHSFRGCWKDLEIADTLVRDDGYIMGHDYNQAENYGVIEAVDRFVKERGYRLVFVTHERAKSYLIAKTQQSMDRILTVHNGQ